MAKALKQDIDKLRAAGEAAATGHIAELPKSRRATDPEEIFNRVLGRCVCPVCCLAPLPLNHTPSTHSQSSHTQYTQTQYAHSVLTHSVHTLSTHTLRVLA